MRPIILLMAGLSFLRDCTETIILPVLPALALYLHASKAEIQLLVPIFSSGILITKLVLVNGYAEKLGYKKLLLSMLPLTIIGSLISLIHGVEFLYFGRFLQGCGLGCITSIVVCELKLQTGSNFMKTWSGLSKYLRFSALIGSFIGATLLKYCGWQAIFICLLVLSSVMYSFLARASFAKKKPADLPPLKSILKTLLTNKGYLAQINFYALIYSGQAIFYTISPFLFINDLGLSPHAYAFVIAAFTGSQFCSKFVLERFITKERANLITFICLAGCSSSGIIFLIGFGLHITHAIIPLVGFMIYSIGFSALGPIVKDNIAEKFSFIQSSAIGVQGIAFSATASILTFLMSRIVDIDLFVVGIIYVAICLLALVLYFIFIHEETRLKKLKY